jgi:xanthine/uracil permease
MTRWGSAEYIGLGFLSFITIVIVEMFGSPFMRNASIIMGLVVGMIVAGATGYVDSSSIDRAPAITFLWVKRFKLGVYGPAVLPSLAVYVVLAMEAIGDITASADLSLILSPNLTAVSKVVSWPTVWPDSSLPCSPSRP